MSGRLKAVEPVWWLIVLIATAAAVLYVAWIRHLDPILGADVGWWWVLGIMVFVTERWPVELEFRRSSHSLSLTDIPLTLALIFTSGTHAFVAVMAGALVALLLRRGSAVKFAFNLAQFALVTSVLIVIVHLAASADPGFGWITWGAVLVASQVGSVLTTAQILAAIVLTEGKVSRAQVREMFGLDYAVTLVGTATALVGAVVWLDRPEALPLLLIPIVIVFICYRAYIQEREGHEKVKTLYETNQTLSESPRSPSPSRACCNGHSKPSTPSRPKSSCSPPTVACRCAPASARARPARRWRRSTRPRPRRSAPAPRAPMPRSRCSRRSRQRWIPTSSTAGCGTACSLCCASRIA